MLELTCTNEEKIRVVASPVTSTGGPAMLDGALAVSVTSGEATVEMETDLSFYLISGDNPGDTTFLVEADADLGEGVELLQDTITLHVAGARAVNFGLMADPPVPK